MICKLSRSTMQHKNLDIILASGNYMSNAHSKQFITNALHLQQLSTRKTF